MQDDIVKLCERLVRKKPSGHWTVGSGCLSSDGAFTGTPSVQIMCYANPDGVEAAGTIKHLSTLLEERDHFIVSRGLWNKFLLWIL